MDQTQQVVQNLGVEIANKVIENASLKAQVNALQAENEQLKSRIAELNNGEN